MRLLKVLVKMNSAKEHLNQLLPHFKINKRMNKQYLVYLNKKGLRDREERKEKHKKRKRRVMKRIDRVERILERDYD
jgi:DNA polymerase III alpha subunit